MKYDPLVPINLLACLAAMIAIPGAAADLPGTRMLHQGTLSADQIAFVYANDLWTADRDGGNPRQLTRDDGVEARPHFSPDGQWIAFSAEYDGNLDVFLMPAQGGIPKRLTWHPGPDLTQGFTPDGQAVLFCSPRQSSNVRYTQFYTVSVDGGFPQPLPIPNGYKASYSPDGHHLAYTPLRDVFQQWKHYRGGTTSRIWIYAFDDAAVTQIPQPEGRCNDTDPMWLNEYVYFLSDRDGEFNLYAFDPKDESITACTQFTDFPILHASAGSDAIIFEQAGTLHLFDPATSKSTPLIIDIAADLVETRPRYVEGDKYVRSASISPTGARAVLETRGEIVTVPKEKGDARILTQTPGVNERSPIWSPDGRSIAYFSDRGGEYALHVVAQDGSGDARVYPLNGTGFYERPEWSPDGQKISFIDNSQSLYILDLSSGTLEKVAQEEEYTPVLLMTHDWSPDSGYLAYTLNDHGLIQTVYVYSLEKNRSFRITDGLSDASEPVFDASGKYLYFFASTDAGPIKQWFAMSNNDMNMTRSLYLAVLSQDEPSPLAPESDEEKPAEATQADQPQKDKDKKSKGKKKEKDDEEANEKKIPKTVIDFAGLDQRIIALPIPAGAYANLRTGAEGEVFYLKREPRSGFGAFFGSGSLEKFTLKDKKTQSIRPDVLSFTCSHDRKNLLIRSGRDYFIVGTSEANNGKGRLNLDPIRLRIEPRAEWPQIFHEAWRINRDYFYAPNFHGVDWEAMHHKYEVFLPHVAVREDLNLLIGWMCSELSVGHHRGGGGDSFSDPKSVPVGLLGADYEIDQGRYRFKTIYGGLNWTPDLRAPLTVPGVDVQQGDCLLAVDGHEVTAADNLFSFFEFTAGRTVTLRVGRDPSGSGAREVQVQPIENELSLRNRAWIEGNIKRVDEATDGRVAYVYVPDTSTSGHRYFKRYFFPQTYKDAIILDERFNRGGQVADYYIDLLRRPHSANWATRYGRDIVTPKAAIFGPKVMIIDETAGSGGDLLPWMFRKFDLGPIIGKRTWGGLVGILGFPELMDGGFITAPNIAIWTEDGWVVENEGVPPDIEVEQWPKEVQAGRDPQLEKAIEVVLEQLKDYQPIKLERPPYPVRNH